MNSLSTFLDRASDQIRYAAVTLITICGKITLLHGSSSLTWYLI